MKMLIVLLGLMFSVVGFSKDVFTETKVSSIATSYEAYMRIADEHLNYGRTEEAIVYYELAVGASTKKSKLRGYMQLVENYYKMDMEWDAGSWHRKASNYLQANPKFKKDEENYLFFLYYKVILSGDLSKEVLTDEELAVFEGDDIMGQVFEHDFKTNMVRQDYDEALKMYDGMDMSNFPMTSKINYDLASFLNNKGNIKSLICSASLVADPYMKDYYASYNFCYVLETYLATKKKDDAKMTVLKKLIEEKDLELMYLYNAFNSSI